MFPGDWDALRGVGATIAIPVSSAGKENLLCLANDPYAGEQVLVQTFATAVLLALERVDGSTFGSRLDTAYDDAMRAGLWQNTYAMENPIEYYAVGVQAWFDAKPDVSPPDGVHNDINTRAELDPVRPDAGRPGGRVDARRRLAPHVSLAPGVDDNRRRAMFGWSRIAMLFAIAPAAMAGCDAGKTKLIGSDNPGGELRRVRPPRRPPASIRFTTNISTPDGLPVPVDGGVSDTSLRAASSSSSRTC